MNAHSASVCRRLLSRHTCGFGHKVKFVGHKVKFVGHKMRILSGHKMKLRARSHRTERLQKRKPMISVGFERVSKKRPCRICGKPTYCGFSRDEGTSICMRISAGSRGLSRNGGNIHVHPEIPFITIRPRIKRPISQSIPLAPLEIRDAVFRELIKISPASNYMEEQFTPGHFVLRLSFAVSFDFCLCFSGAFGTWPPPMTSACVPVLTPL